MLQGMIGKKIGMTQVFDENSVLVVATMIQAGPCYVVAKKTVEKDGYDSYQLGFEEVKPQRVNKPMAGNFKKAKVPPVRHLREFRGDSEEYSPGDVVKVDIFENGELLDVTGTSKGKGFAGTMKRYNFAGQPDSHGGMAHRRPGSIGQASYPAKVWKGFKMPGRMGGDRVTVRGLKVVQTDPENNLILVKGSVPGPNGGTVILKRSTKGVKHLA